MGLGYVLSCMKPLGENNWEKNVLLGGWLNYSCQSILHGNCYVCCLAVLLPIVSILQGN